MADQHSGGGIGTTRTRYLPPAGRRRMVLPKGTKLLRTAVSARFRSTKKVDFVVRHAHTPHPDPSPACGRGRVGQGAGHAYALCPTYSAFSYGPGKRALATSGAKKIAQAKRLFTFQNGRVAGKLRGRNGFRGLTGGLRPKRGLDFFFQKKFLEKKGVKGCELCRRIFSCLMLKNEHLSGSFVEVAKDRRLLDSSPGDCGDFLGRGFVVGANHFRNQPPQAGVQNGASGERPIRSRF